MHQEGPLHIRAEPAQTRLQERLQDRSKRRLGRDHIDGRCLARHLMNAHEGCRPLLRGEMDPERGFNSDRICETTHLWSYSARVMAEVHSTSASARTA